MKWIVKAAIQNVLSWLPGDSSLDSYYVVKRKFGALKPGDPTTRLHAGARIVGFINAAGKTVEGKTVLETGTGHRLNLPIALWLCGAGKIITTDLNPYLTEELILEDIGFIEKNPKAIAEIFGDLAKGPIFQDRLRKLSQGVSDLQQVLKLLNLEYLAPVDSTKIPLPDNSVDYHVSLTVFEHIPVSVLKGILAEAKRLLAEGGLSIHNIDFSDHFSHSDKTITSINFLRFNESAWKAIAGNRFMYHNRCRLNTFLDLFAEMNYEVVQSDVTVDDKAVQALEQGFKLNQAFAGLEVKNLASSSAWIVAKVAQI